MGMFNFLFGDDYRAKAQRDQYRPSTIGKNFISPINDYGHCFKCDGTGQRTLTCKICSGSGMHTGQCRGCSGTGTFSRPAKECFVCNGTGKKYEKECRKCIGTGEHLPAISQVCNRCDGFGTFKSECRRCNGAGDFNVQCKKCDGSGWHRF